MKRWLAAMTLCFFIVPSPVSAETTTYPGDEEAASDARKDLEQTLTLWRDGRLREVFERTVPSSGESRESFIRTLSGSFRKPACCWEKLQEVRVAVTDGAQVTVTARFGIEEPEPGTVSVTKSVKMVKEDGVWKVRARDLTGLAKGKKGKAKKGKAKKARSHRLKPTIVRTEG
jgi:hypothetical protein